MRLLLLILGLIAACGVPGRSAPTSSAPAAPNAVEEVRVGEGVFLTTQPSTAPAAEQNGATSQPAIGAAASSQPSTAAAPKAPKSTPRSKRKRNAAPAVPTSPTTLPDNPALYPLATVKFDQGYLSSTMVVVPTSMPTQLLLAENTMIVDRPGWVERNEKGAWVMQFQQLETDTLPIAPLELLPTQVLAGMELAVEANVPNRVIFRVNGEVTNFHGERYLLVRKALMEEMPAGQPSDAPQSQPATQSQPVAEAQPATQAQPTAQSQPQSQSQPASAPAVAGVRREPK